MSVGFVAVIIIVVIVVVNYDDIDPNDNDTDINVIEYGDSAILEFQMWADTDGDGDIEWNEYHDDAGDETEPDMGGIIYPTILEDLEPHGFYSHMIGMKQGDYKRFVLEANVDDNKDFIDDNTGDPTVSYGNPSSAFYNTAIRYYIKILNITKEGEDLLPFNVPQSSNPNSASMNASTFRVTDLLYSANSLLGKKFN